MAGQRRDDPTQILRDVKIRYVCSAEELHRECALVCCLRPEFSRPSLLDFLTFHHRCLHFHHSHHLRQDMSSAAASLPYHEPGIVTILILASFVLVENVVNFVFDRVLFCGLIGQIAVGLAWGTPGANWLSLEAQNAIVQLGYLGLILIVYEGEFLATMLSNRR